MLRTLTGTVSLQAREVVHLPLLQGSKFVNHHRRNLSATSCRPAQPDALDKNDEDVQRILREYGVDPDEVGDKRLEEKKRKKEKRVEDFAAWKDWDGMVDKKDHPELPVFTSRSKTSESDGAFERDVAEPSTSVKPTPLMINPLPMPLRSSTTTTSTASSSTSPRYTNNVHAERFQKKLNEHIHTLRAEADALRKTLAVRTEVLRSKASERAKALEQNARLQFGMLGGRMNELTGYNEIDRLKREVTEKEEDISRLRAIAREAKTGYDDAVATRTESQREVNSLLERKHGWTDADVIRFTSLVRADHTSNHAVRQTKTALVEAEAQVERAFDALMKSILHRYHEEQVWSDKIRSVSTYGSLIVLVVNLVVFLGAIAVVEPWKRKRLVKGLEAQVKGMMETVEGKVEHEMIAVKELLHGVNFALAGISTDSANFTSLDPGLPNGTTKQDVGVQYEAPASVHPAVSTPTGGLFPRSIIFGVSEQLAKISPKSGNYISGLDPHKVDAAVMGTAGLVLGAACMAAMSYLR